MSKNGPLDFEATIDAKTFNAMLDEMERRIKGVSGTVVKEGAEMDKTFRNIGAGMAAYFSAQQLGDFVTQVANVRGEFQQLEISFETMLKNKALSDKLMADVVEFAAKTPFDLQQVATGAKQLLAYGTQVNDIIPTMRQLGDVAAGLSIPFGELVYLYGTSATQGKLMTKDLMQFAGRGIPIIEELSKILKVSKAEVMNLTESGKIGFTELQQVIENLTSSTGMFGGMMEKQAASINGLRSNLGDAWDQMLNDIGKSNEGLIEGTIKTGISVVENYQRVLDILKVIIATYGSYQAAIILNTVALSGYSTALNLATIRQTALNIAQKASPWGLVLTGITALIGGVWAYNRAMLENKKALLESNAGLLKQVSETDRLVSALKSSNITEHERAKILEELKKVNPDVTDEIIKEGDALQTVIEKYEQYNLLTKSKASIDTFKAQNNFDVLAENLDEAQKQIEGFRVQMDVLWVDLLSNFNQLMEQNAESVPAMVKEMFNSIEEEGLNSEQAIAKILKKREEIFNERRTYGPTSKSKNEYYDFFTDANKFINTYQYGQSIREVTEATNEYQAVVKSTETFIDNLVGTYKNLNAQQQEDLKFKLKLQYIPNFEQPKEAPKEEVIQLTVLQKIKSIRAEIAAQEKALNALKSPSAIYNAEKINEAEAALSGLNKQLDSLVGKPVKQESLKEQIGEIKQSYQNYYRWIERYGKESADKQFANLIKGGKSYLEYLEKQIKTLESKPVKSDKDVNDLSTYLGAKDDLTGAKTRIELFEEEVDSAKEKYTDLVDYINYLKENLLAVGAFDGSELSFEKIRILYERMSEAERDFIKESANTYQKAIEEVAGFAEKRILIEKEYAAEVKKLDPVSLGDEKYAEAIAALEKIKNEKLYEILKNEVEATEAYKKLTNDFERLTAGEASRYLGLLKEQLATLQDQPEIYNQVLSLISEIEGKLANTKARNVSEVLSESARLLDIVISQLDGVDESFLAIASSISKVVGELSTVSESFAKNSATGKASNPLQGFSSLAGIFFTIADGLDKQFGMQKKIADVEEARAEYNRKLSMTLETITSELDKQLKLLDDLSVGEAYNPSIEALKASIRSASQELENFRLDFAKSPPNVRIQFDIDHLKDIFKTDDTAKALNQAFSEGLITEEQYNLAVQYLSTIEDAEEQLKQLHEEYKDAILGTTSEAITDSIIEGLMAGKRGIEDFAGTFEDMMKQALINSMMVKAIQPQIDKFMDTFFAVTNDANGLSQADISSLQSVWEVLINGWGKTFDEMESMFPDLFDATNEANSLSGAIKGVTEETAGLIAGQMNAIRINQAHVLALMDEQLTYQMEIAANTRYNRKLDLLPQILNELRKGSSSASTSSRAAGGE